MTHQDPKIAIAPSEHAWHDGVVDAVKRGGGTVVAPDQAEALVWLEGRGGTGLGAVLHPGIRWVQLPAAGVEGWITSGDITSDRTYTSAGGAYARSVAEHVVAFVLAAARRLPACAKAESWEDDELEGRLLRGATVGIIGAGGIGREAISYLQPFGVRIVAVTRRGRDVPGADVSLSSDALAEVWPMLDYAVLLAPATKETAALVGATELAQMPDDAWVLNLGRGSLLDTGALVDALDAGTIGGAALDVTDPEPLPDGHPLWAFPNVLITPHVANPSRMRGALFADHVEANVARFGIGEELLATVSLETGY